MYKPEGSAVPVEPWHVQELLADVRDEDRLEFEAVAGLPVDQEVNRALGMSESSCALVIAGKVAVLFGCMRLDDRIGIPWMISSHHLTKHPRSFLWHCNHEISLMRQRYVLLLNYTDARYTAALKWMRWCGFEQHPVEPYGVNGELFHPFTMKGDLWVQ